MSGAGDILHSQLRVNIVGKRNKLRVAVGDPSGPRSSTWLVASGRSDIYLSARALASRWKFSLHFPRPPEHPATFRYVGYTSEHVRLVAGAKDGGVHNRVHIQPVPFKIHGDIFAEMIVRIPGTELRPMTGDVRGIHWLPTPPRGMTAQLLILSGPATFDTSQLVDPRSGRSCLREFHLADERKVWVLSEVVATNPGELADARTLVRAWKASGKWPVADVGDRVALFGTLPVGIAVALEIAVDSA